MKRDLWNKCDICGRIIPYADLENGKAIHRLVTPDSAVSSEKTETLCKNHNKPRKEPTP